MKLRRSGSRKYKRTVIFIDQDASRFLWKDGGLIEVWNVVDVYNSDAQFAYDVHLTPREIAQLLLILVKDGYLRTAPQYTRHLAIVGLPCTDLSLLSTSLRPFHFAEPLERGRRLGLRIGYSGAPQKRQDGRWNEYVVDPPSASAKT